ncbi:MAG TPA: MHYT domain-containing protein [Verrucomicrobiae bacterium]|nr:MHYT domain-containing protein [Verrucomicrobiae bacterium]
MNASALTPTYDFRLVALSVVIAICASYAALDLVGRITAAQKNARVAWFIGGAIAMGTGIWSMHYTGMLAYHLPIPVYYHIPTVILSLAAAIGASFIALFVVSRPRISLFHVAAGSLVIATGISGMHYIGMASMRLAAMHHWDQTFVVLSMVIALVVALSALGLASLFREEGEDRVLKGVCAIIMGIAIPAMHYTGMAAVSYTPMSEKPNMTNAMDISVLANTAIVVVTFIVIGSVFLFQRPTAAPKEPAHPEALGKTAGQETF